MGRYRFPTPIPKPQTPYPVFDPQNRHYVEFRWGFHMLTTARPPKVHFVKSCNGCLFFGRLARPWKAITMKGHTVQRNKRRDNHHSGSLIGAVWAQRGGDGGRANGWVCGDGRSYRLPGNLRDCLSLRPTALRPTSIPSPASSSAIIHGLIAWWRKGLGLVFNSMALNVTVQLKLACISILS